MGWRYKCKICGSSDVEYLGQEMWFCKDCGENAPAEKYPEYRFRLAPHLDISD